MGGFQFSTPMLVLAIIGVICLVLILILAIASSAREMLLSSDPTYSRAASLLVFLLCDFLLSCVLFSFWMLFYEPFD
jgi:hypothetical protein